ncbi:uncharacterized protein CDAR_226441 [Caerostris darwini]|uniref:Uncharacterized protein n=1 Tax=Caerostris darwini TaxID=1538125 RepID=A0AAV4V4I2_9ARAC|nr:uncharacterized protein CDAR_226441 [Caerostris darwini]
MSLPARYVCKILVLLYLCACTAASAKGGANDTTTTTAKPEALLPEAASSLVETSVNLEGQETRPKASSHVYSQGGKGYLQQESVYSNYPQEEQAYEYGKRIANYYKGNDDNNAYHIQQQQEDIHYPQSGYSDSQGQYEQQQVNGYDHSSSKGSSFPHIKIQSDSYGQEDYGKDGGQSYSYKSGGGYKEPQLQYSYGVSKKESYAPNDQYDAKSYGGQASYNSEGEGAGYQGKGYEEVSYSKGGIKGYSSPVSHVSQVNDYGAEGNGYSTSGKVSHFPVFPKESGYLSGGHKEPEYLQESPKQIGYQQEAGYVAGSGKDLGYQQGTGYHGSSGKKSGYQQEVGYHADSGKELGYGQEGGYVSGKESGYGQEGGYVSGKELGYGQEGGYVSGKELGYGQEGGYVSAGDQYGSKNGERHGYLLLPVVPGQADDKIKIQTTGYGGSEYKSEGLDGYSAGYSQKPGHENSGKVSYTSYFKSGASSYGTDASIPSYGGNSKSYGGNSKSYGGDSTAGISAYGGDSKSSGLGYGGGSSYGDSKSSVSDYEGNSKSYEGNSKSAYGGNSKSYEGNSKSAYGGNSKFPIPSYGGKSENHHMEEIPNYLLMVVVISTKNCLDMQDILLVLVKRVMETYKQLKKFQVMILNMKVKRLGSSYGHVAIPQYEKEPVNYEGGKPSLSHSSGYGINADNVKYIPAQVYEHQQAYGKSGSYDVSSSPKGTPYVKEVQSHNVHSSYSPSQKGSYDGGHVSKTSVSYGKQIAAPVKEKYSQPIGYGNQNYGAEIGSPYIVSSAEKHVDIQGKGFPQLSYGSFTPMISPYGSVVDFSRSAKQGKKTVVSSKGYGDGYKSVGAQQGSYGHSKQRSSSYGRPKSFAVVLQRSQGGGHGDGYGSAYSASTNKGGIKTSSHGYSGKGFQPIIPKYRWSHRRRFRLV